jgi:hypothetical protein
MELQYVKELEKYDLQVKNLPEDAQTGIKEIKKGRIQSVFYLFFMKRLFISPPKTY